MTTPAENTNQSILVSGSRYYHQCGGANVGLTNYPNLLRGHVVASRPASTNHPINQAGWRDPGPWSHSKLVDNPVPNTTVTAWDTNCSYTIYLNGAGWTNSGSSLPAFLSYLEGRAVSRALLKLKHQQVNLAVAFAERRQTMDLFSSNAKTIARQVSRYKGAHPKDWAKVTRSNVRYWRSLRHDPNGPRFGPKQVIGGDVPNSWLELQYGWKPLISDVNGACHALSDLQSGSNPYLARVKGFAAEEVRTTWRKTSSTSACYGFDVTEKWKHFCKVSLYYKLRNPQLAAFASLGLTNPFELAWEKMKYSFVVDWFLPVGNWLSSLDADFGWDFNSGTVTKFIRGGSTSVWRASCFPPSVIKVTFSGDTYKADGFSMTRSLYGSAPWAGLPRFKNPLSSQHVANAVALLVQAFRR